MTKASPIETRANPGTPCITMEFGSISEPGTYICNWSGHLLRIPEDGVAPGRSPLIDLVSNESLFVTKISDDPYIARTKARILAANSDVHVNF